MNITVIGTGYVGLIVGLGFAEFGNNVTCMDTDRYKIEQLQQGFCPIYEPGAELLLEHNIKAGRISFTADSASAVRQSEIIFIAVNTPESETGDADLSYMFQAAREIGRYIEHYTVIVDKSTVPVGTARKVKEVIETELNKRGVQIPFSVASNPEFLREGKAVNDFFNPDRIIIGTDDTKAADELKRVYSIFERSHKPILITSLETAEMIKYATNSFLATKIAFINEVANLCEKTGANALDVAKAMGMDGRISPKFLHPGPGFGGSCFPKDTKAFASIGRNYGAPLSIVESVVTSNKRQKELAAEKIILAMNGKGVIAILGLAFKSETDDVRESPAIEIIRILVETGGFTLRLYDPQAVTQAKKALGDEISNDTNIVWCDSSKEALEGAEAAVVLTEWLEFRALDFKEYDHIHFVFDFRNIYKRSDFETTNIKYLGKGI